MLVEGADGWETETQTFTGGEASGAKAPRRGYENQGKSMWFWADGVR